MSHNHSVTVTTTKHCSTRGLCHTGQSASLDTDIGVDLARNQTAVHDRCSRSQGQTLPSRVRRSHFTNTEYCRTRGLCHTGQSASQETDIGVDLARNQSAVHWEPRTDLAIPTMTGRPHHMDRDWQQPPPDRSAHPSHNHITKFLKLQRSGLDEVLETIYNTVERTNVPSLPAHLRALKDQRSDMDKVLEIIYNNINQERPDVPTCQPELKRKLYGLTTTTASSS